MLFLFDFLVFFVDVGRCFFCSLIFDEGMLKLRGCDFGGGIVDCFVFFILFLEGLIVFNVIGLGVGFLIWFGCCFV